MKIDMIRKAYRGLCDLQRTISYLNTDLNISSSKPFNRLVKYLETAGLIKLRYIQEKRPNGSRIWSGWFETDTANKNPEASIRAFIKVFERFTPELSQEWNTCQSRTLSIGYECGDGPWGYTNSLSSRLIDKINKMQLGVEVVIYPNRAIGIWRSQTRKLAPDKVYQSKLTLNIDDTYEIGGTVNGQYCSRQTGTYEISGDNVLNLTMKDSRSNRTVRRSIHMPESESFTFEFVDQNTIRAANRLGSVLMHRVR